VIASAFPQVGIGLVGVSPAFGLSVVTMAYAIGHISGCHLNPAVTIGLTAGGRFTVRDVLPYVAAQVIGAIAGAAVLYVIASGTRRFQPRQGLCRQWLRRPFPGQVWARSGADGRGGADHDVRVRHHGRDARQHSCHFTR
jgi:aquaporin Z